MNTRGPKQNFKIKMLLQEKQRMSWSGKEKWLKDREKWRERKVRVDWI